VYFGSVLLAKTGICEAMKAQSSCDIET